MHIGIGAAKCPSGIFGGWAFYASLWNRSGYGAVIATVTSATRSASARRMAVRHVEQYTGLPLRGTNGTDVSCLHSAQVTSVWARSGKPSFAFRADRQWGHLAGILMSSFSRKKCCSPAVHVNGLLQSRQVSVLSRNSTNGPSTTKVHTGHPPGPCPQEKTASHDSRLQTRSTTELPATLPPQKSYCNGLRVAVQDILWEKWRERNPSVEMIGHIAGGIMPAHGEVPPARYRFRICPVPCLFLRRVSPCRCERVLRPPSP